MINRTILVVLILLMSPYSYACEKQGFYLGGGYYGQFINTINSLQIKTSTGKVINTAKIHDKRVFQTPGQPVDKYKPSYTPPFAANIKFGYIKQSHNNTNFRIELEGMYALIKVKNISLNNGPLVLVYTDSNNTVKQAYGVTINNNRIENLSIMANAYCYWKINNFSFRPYIGLGVGGTRIKVYEKPSIKPAYQLKAGLNYRITKDTDLYIGYKHFGAIGSSGSFETYRGITVNASGSPEERQTGVVKDDNNTTLSHGFFSTHGIEMGLVIRFN